MTNLILMTVLLCLRRIASIFMRVFAMDESKTWLRTIMNYLQFMVVFMINDRISQYYSDVRLRQKVT